MREFLTGDMRKTLPDIEDIEAYWPSVKQENRKFLRRMWEVRDPEHLDQRVIEYLDRQGMPSPEIRGLYEEQKEVLTELLGDPDTEEYKRDLLFHGTGKLKYGKEKYGQGGEFSDRETKPVLLDVLENGLQPHMDMWDPKGDAASISLTESYFYSKWYAAKYMSEGNEPEWQLGDPNDYFPFFIYDSFKREFGEPKHWLETLEKILRDGPSMRNVAKKRAEHGQDRPQRFINWLSSFTREGASTKGFNEQLNLKSDIPDNWGAVICIDKKTVQASSDMLGIGVHETRSTGAITPEQFKAIVVPARHINDMQALLEKSGHPDIPVIAMESAELHMAQFDMSELVARSEGK